jgi:hypothetical protein|tara:strand:+ start:53 stop:493 length:441 start_codon:yes stop_codon:yes gene_type:complete
MPRPYRKYTDEQLFAAVKSSKSIAGVLKTLGLRVAGGNYAQIKKYVQSFDLDTSHWKGQGWNKDDKLKDWSQYNKVSSLKPHLIKQKGHKCEQCNKKHWNKRKMPLEVHHVDGNRTNNRFDNLKLLCCNCHALTHNWRGRKNAGLF